MKHFRRYRQVYSLSYGNARARFFSYCSVQAFLFFFAALLFSAPELYAEPRQSIDIIQAVSAAMHLDPNIELAEETYNFASGVAQEQKGRFDLQTEASASVEQNHTIFTRDQRETFQRTAVATDATSFSAGVSKLTRYGQTVGIQAAVERIEDEISNPTSPNRGTLRFTILQPLLRGRGNEVTTAAEKRALFEKQASRYDLQRQIALSIGESAKAYWEYLAATENVRILREAEKRTAARHEEMKQLVKGDTVPATILEQSAAELFFPYNSKNQCRDITLFDPPNSRVSHGYPI